MRKGSNAKKLSKPGTILRRVLSKTSNTPKRAKPPVETMENHKETKSGINIEAELLLLKQQIANLQLAVNTIQQESEQKEVAIANLAREKERLAVDLKRQQRSNTNLKQQLDDERDYYYKEKEQYCQEMNDCKKLKKNLRHIEHKSELDYYKKEASKLKDTLKQTFEANYNLSVKFLRMKNTKFCLKNRLKKLEVAHDNMVADFNMHMEILKNELADTVDKQLLVPIPPSNKKYLQIVKQNGMLTHENLCLRLEMDRQNLEIERLKMLQITNDTNNKLKYINNRTKSETLLEDHRPTKHHNRRLSLDADDDPNNRNLDDENDNDEPHGRASEGPVRKLYEKTKRPDTPCITILPLDSEEPVEDNDIDEDKYDLLRLSDKLSQTSTQTSRFTQQSIEAVRTRSAPEIVQNSFFVNDT